MPFLFSSRLHRAERGEDHPASAATFHRVEALIRRRDDPEELEEGRKFLKEERAFGKRRAYGDSCP
jgi:hypothetical protein